MDYDIRSAKNAGDTLERMTGIPLVIWQEESLKASEEYSEDIIERVIREHSGKIPKYDDIDFIFSHITTSIDGCASIKKYGVVDLKSAYKNPDTELRRFLDSKGIEIIVDYYCLKYNNEYYSIEFDRYDCPPEWRKLEYLGWCVGRKFDLDPGVCGFLSMDTSGYLGMVHKRPEILFDIDNLLDTSLSDEWAESRLPYEVLIRKNSKYVEPDFEIDISDNEKVLHYLVMAYDILCGAHFEHTIQCLKNEGITPSDIIEIKPFTLWD